MFQFQGQDGVALFLQLVILGAIALWLGIGVLLAVDRVTERRWRQRAERRGRSMS